MVIDERSAAGGYVRVQRRLHSPLRGDVKELRSLAAADHPDRTVEGREISRPVQRVVLGVPKEHQVEQQQEREKGKKERMQIPFFHKRWNYFRVNDGMCQANSICGRRGGLEVIISRDPDMAWRRARANGTLRNLQWRALMWGGCRGTP